MKRLKSVFAIAVMIAAAGAVQTANAQATLKVLMVGASGTWQAMAIGTYKVGSCPTGARAGCGHASYGKPTAVTVTDTRPSTPLTDTGASIWIVWDNTAIDPTCATSCNVWAYVKVDSIVGNRCFFAQPRCETQIVSPGAPDNLISVGTAWPTEVTPPAPVLALFSSGTTRVNVAVSEVRPEDAAFGQCRINSQLGGGNDGLNGLGYGANASGVCPTFGSPNTRGTDLVSAYPSSTTTAHPLAFNISGHDPITNTLIPAYTSVNLGAEPLVFMTNRQSATGLKALSDVSLSQLQTVFSGTSCKASDLTGSGADTDSINVFMREPLSGTMNAAEYTAFRLPRDSGGNYAGKSQETAWASGGVGFTGATASNVACTAGGSRYQSVGNGDETKFIQHSNDGTLPTSRDGIGYMFFSYGNVSSLADSANFGYLQINGVDPVWQLYGATYDPAQPPTAGELPSQTDLPDTAPSGLGGGCGTGAVNSGVFPCPETRIWKGKLSFPNVRSGAYRQWIMARLIGTTGSTPLANAQALVTSAQASVVTKVPDFIPAAAVTATIGGVSFTDPGLKLLHSHYTQDGVSPVNAVPDAGGDVGGCILPGGSSATKLVYRDPGCVAGP